MIRAVLFDLFETLITERGVGMPRASSLGCQLGFNGAAFRSEWRTRRHAVILGRRTFREALLEIAARLGREINRRELDRVCHERIRAKAVVLARVEPRVLAVLGALRSRGLHLGLVSNCFAEDVTAWSESAAGRLFDCAVFSFEVGVAKPTPEIYLEAITRLGVSPDNTAFVGDGMDDELAGASSVGLRTFQARWFVRSQSNRSPGGVLIPGLQSIEDVLAVVQ
jgi:HAD superfamily hydrolase (TIGR01509 family)